MKPTAQHHPLYQSSQTHFSHRRLIKILKDWSFSRTTRHRLIKFAGQERSTKKNTLLRLTKINPGFCCKDELGCASTTTYHLQSKSNERKHFHYSYTGLNRQIRRMWSGLAATVGVETNCIMNIKLGNIAVGKWRLLRNRRWNETGWKRSDLKTSKVISSVNRIYISFPATKHRVASQKMIVVEDGDSRCPTSSTLLVVAVRSKLLQVADAL